MGWLVVLSSPTHTIYYTQPGPTLTDRLLSLSPRPWLVGSDPGAGANNHVACAWPGQRYFPAAMAAVAARRQQRLPPEVNRVIYVRNLPFSISSEEMYELFGKYGAIRQIRIGTSKETRGTAYVVYDDIYDAKQAADHLSGFNVQNRYLIVLYYNPSRLSKKANLKDQEAQLRAMQERHGVDGQQHAKPKQ